MALKFFWNGIKGSDGKLWRCYYSDGALLHHPAGTITIYAKDYGRAPADIDAAFAIENDTEIQTDYFEKDRIRVLPTHPLYGQVRTSMEARIARYNAKRPQRWAA